MNPVLDMNSANRLINPFKFSEETNVNGKNFVIKYTKRANKALQKRTSQLIIEMQIYFSCVVQKRVLFHDSYKREMTSVNDKMAVALRVVESDSCDPDYYANNHPEKRELDSNAAKKMTAKELILDYKDGNWIANFKIA